MNSCSSSKLIPSNLQLKFTAVKPHNSHPPAPCPLPPAPCPLLPPCCPLPPVPPGPLPPAPCPLPPAPCPLPPAPCPLPPTPYPPYPCPLPHLPLPPTPLTPAPCPLPLCPRPRPPCPPSPCPRPPCPPFLFKLTSNLDGNWRIWCFSAENSNTRSHGRMVDHQSLLLIVLFSPTNLSRSHHYREIFLTVNFRAHRRSC